MWPSTLKTSLQVALSCIYFKCFFVFFRNLINLLYWPRHCSVYWTLMNINLNNCTSLYFQGRRAVSRNTVRTGPAPKTPHMTTTLWCIMIKMPSAMVMDPQSLPSLLNSRMWLVNDWTWVNMMWFNSINSINAVSISHIVLFLCILCISTVSLWLLNISLGLTSVVRETDEWRLNGELPYENFFFSSIMLILQ